MRKDIGFGRGLELQRPFNEALLLSLRTKSYSEMLKKNERFRTNRRQTHYKPEMAHCVPQGRTVLNRAHPDSQGRCAHPRRTGGYKSPASRPGTGVFGQGPAAATPPC